MRIARIKTKSEATFNTKLQNISTTLQYLNRKQQFKFLKMLQWLNEDLPLNNNKYFLYIIRLCSCKHCGTYSLFIVLEIICYHLFSQAKQQLTCDK